MDDFWENGGFFVSARSASLDAHLSGDTSGQVSARRRTELLSGTRVAFKNTLSALLTYPEPPDGFGTVVKCRTASGDTTTMDGLAFVKWDDGRFLPVHVSNLRRAPSADKTAAVYRAVVAMGDLTDFFKASEDSLVHKSSKDLWKLSKSGDEFIIERLFDGDGKPLKV